MEYLIENKKCKLKKGHNSEKMHFELSSLIVWIALWIANTYSEFQVNFFSNNRDITKGQSFSKLKKGIILRKKCILNCLP